MTDQPAPPPPPQQPPPMQPAPAQAYVQPVGSSSKATPSLVLGIVGILCCGICAILAIIFGKQAKDEIAANPGMEGAGMAQAGFILGIVGCAVWGISLLVYLIALAASA